MNILYLNMFKVVFLLTLLLETAKANIKINGEVKVIGLFQIYETEDGKCSTKVSRSSVMTSEAVKWYIEALQNHAQLPFTIGFEAYKTCRQIEKAADIALTVMNRSMAKDGIAGIIGPEFSSEAEVISPILSSGSRENRVPQIGFSTTALQLGNEDAYPNFIRMVPADNVQVDVMIQSMVQLEWNRIAIVYDDDTYGVEAAFSLKAKAEEKSICVAMFESISVKDGLIPSEITALLNEIIIGFGNRPSINAIVFIGSSSTARSMLLILNNAGYSSVPIIMFSDGTALDTSVFRQYNGQVLSKAKGSLVLSPTYREITEFTEHWRSIFTNSSYFQKEKASNPWLQDVYYDITQCDERDCDFKELTDTAFDSVFRQQPLYIQYAVLAAHTLVKGVHMVYQNNCPTPGNCATFPNTLNSGEILDEIKGISIDLETDFQWSLDSLSTAGLQMTINSSGEIIMPEDKSIYQLFNFRVPDGSPSDFSLIKIADYVDHTLLVEKDKIRDYATDGSELLWPDVRRGTCEKSTICTECVPLEALQESVIFQSGDLYLVALIPVFDRSRTGGCGNIRKISGYQTVEAIRFAVAKVNTKTGDYANFFGDLKIGLIVMNSCNNPVVTQKNIYRLNSKGFRLRNGTVLDLSNKIIGYVGEISSGVSIGAAEVLTRLQKAQISFSSTSPVLSDRSNYPYFMRIVSPDSDQAKAMVGIIQMLESDYVQIIYGVGAYGEGGRNKVKEIAYENNICVVQEVEVQESGSPYEVYEKLRRFSHAKIVVVFLGSHRINEIMSALLSQIETRGEFIFIGSEAWARKQDPLNVDTGHKLLGSYTISIEMYQDSELRDYLRNLQPQPFSKNPWSMLYLQAKRNCYFDFSFDKSMSEKCSSSNDFISDPDFELDTWDTPAFVAAKCLLTGANYFMRAKCGFDDTHLCEDFMKNVQGLIEEIKKIKLALDGSGNKIKVFNANGDGNIGYRIYNIQRDDNLQDLVYTEVGRYPLEGTFTFEKEITVTPTENDFISTCPNDQACVGCFKAEEDVEPSNSEAKLDMGMLVLGILLALAVIVVIVLVIIVIRLRRVHYAAATTQYITPMETKRQAAVGMEQFNDIEPPEHNFEIINTGITQDI